MHNYIRLVQEDHKRAVENSSIILSSLYQS